MKLILDKAENSSLNYEIYLALFVLTITQEGKHIPFEVSAIAYISTFLPPIRIERQQFLRLNFKFFRHINLKGEVTVPGLLNKAIQEVCH